MYRLFPLSGSTSVDELLVEEVDGELLTKDIVRALKKFEDNPSGADITKKAMVDLGDSTRLRELDALMVLPVHDEVIMTCPEEHALEVASLMSEIMINSCINDVVVRMSCDAEITRIWTGDDITKELESAV